MTLKRERQRFEEGYRAGLTAALDVVLTSEVLNLTSHPQIKKDIEDLIAKPPKVP